MIRLVHSCGSVLENVGVGVCIMSEEYVLLEGIRSCPKRHILVFLLIFHASRVALYFNALTDSADIRRDSKGKRCRRPPA
jgi:hypothetical protein